MPTAHVAAEAAVGDSAAVRARAHELGLRDLRAGERATEEDREIAQTRRCDAVGAGDDHDDGERGDRRE